MNDTVGIDYQFCITETKDPDIESMRASMPVHDDDKEQHENLRKRRRFIGISRETRFSFFKPAVNMQVLGAYSPANFIEVCKSAIEIALNKDILWIMCLLRKYSIPSWFGYNCIVSINVREIRTIQYLSFINSSPTSYARVNETVIIAYEIVAKCNPE